MKQAFWVNLINSTSLLKLAEIILVKPGLLKKINSQFLWVSLQEKTKIAISGCELNMFQVIHSILRQNQEMPDVGIVKQAKCDPQLFENGIADLVVKNPTAANYMCCFQPCNLT